MTISSGASSRLVVLAILAAVISSVAAAAANDDDSEPILSEGALKGYQAVKEGIRRNKQEMCSFLLSDIDNQNEILDLAKVTYLFESALDHLAKTSDYVTLIRPHVDAKVVSNFDEQGGSYVLEISQLRLRVIEDYETAVKIGASDLKKRKILENYFYKACEIKLSTIIAEKAMYESALKAEKTLQVKLGLSSASSSSR